jgi:hypothetical protein
MKMNDVFWRGFWRGMALGPFWRVMDRAVNGEIVVTCDEPGRVDCYGQQEKEAKIEWVLTTDRMPEHGQMVVKYWNANGNVWAGKHIADAKHSSFDKWIPLPSNASSTPTDAQHHE